MCIFTNLVEELELSLLLIFSGYTIVKMRINMIKYVVKLSFKESFYATG